MILVAWNHVLALLVGWAIPLGSTEEVRLTYTPVYNIATPKDGNNSGTTTYTYNTKLQLTDVKYPLWTSGNTDRVQYTSYDRAGRLLARTDGNGQETTYTYGSSSTDDGLLTAVGYTGAGRVAGVSPPRSKIGWPGFAQLNLVPKAFHRLFCGRDALWGSPDRALWPSPKIFRPGAQDGCWDNGFTI